MAAGRIAAAAAIFGGLGALKMGPVYLISFANRRRRRTVSGDAGTGFSEKTQMKNVTVHVHPHRVASAQRGRSLARTAAWRAG